MNYSKWKTEQAKCESCRHGLVEDDPQQDIPGTILRCDLFRLSTYSRRRMFALYAREEDKCGGDARLWEPK
jgi:hypothetical protein